MKSLHKASKDPAQLLAKLVIAELLARRKEQGPLARRHVVYRRKRKQDVGRTR